LTPAEQSVVDTAILQLNQAAANLKNPANKPQAPAHYDIVKAQAAALKKLPAPSASTPRDAALQKIQAWAKDLQKIFDASQPEPPAPPTFELYEIVQLPGMAPTLRPVGVQ
jgi:hypothetical protein